MLLVFLLLLFFTNQKKNTFTLVTFILILEMNPPSLVELKEELRALGEQPPRVRATAEWKKQFRSLKQRTRRRQKRLKKWSTR
jgi:hypothetical protein